MLRLLLLLSLAPVLAPPGSPSAQSTRRNVAIVVFPGVELMDFAGPGEVFAATHDAFRVYTVSSHAGSMRSMGFLDLRAEYQLEDAPRPDIVVVPGGNAVPDAALEEWLRTCAEADAILMSVCNGAGYLARADLLAGLDVTTHRSAMAGVQREEPTCRVLTNRRFVDNGNIITTAGISAGIDGSLHLIARLLGSERAAATAYYMEYAWDPEGLAELHAQPAALYSAVAANFAQRYRDEGLAVALEEHRRAIQSPATGPGTERELNRIAYQLLNSDEEDQALRLFRHVAETHPASANAQDSLSEALEAHGDTAGAREHALRALALVKEDESLSAGLRGRLVRAAEARLERLESGTPTTFRCPPCGMDCDETVFDKPGTCSDCGAGLVAQTG